MSFTTRPELKGTFGAASSTHWLATASAMSILERGGNAFDAAACAGFVLQVVEPHLNGPGGEVPILFWDESGHRAQVLCGQGVAPAAATIEHFESLGLQLVPGIGLLPACVPGAFGAWMTLLRDHGTMPLRTVLEPAIQYARDGYPLVPRIVQAIVAVRTLFETQWPSSAQIYLPGGDVPSLGKLFSNKALADTYLRLVEEAEKASHQREQQIDSALRGWYQGFVADRIDAFYRTEVMDSSGERQRGLLRGEDMARWRPTYEAPRICDYGDFAIAKCDSWSQGPVMLQQLNLLQADALEGLDPMGDELVHRMVEAAKLAFADRDAWYADPRAIDVPLDELLSMPYAAARRPLIDDRASSLIRPGRPGGLAPQLSLHEDHSRALAAGGFLFGAGEPTFAALPAHAWQPTEEIVVGDTCHIDVADRWGNLVAATPSGGWLSSSPVVPGLGFSLNTRLQMTWLDRRMRNALRPGYRPLTTLSPSLAFKQGQAYAAFGTPGGDQQDQWQTAFAVRHLRMGMTMQEAIDAPAWHMNHFTASFWPRLVERQRLTVESRFPQQSIDALRRRGHEVVVGDAWSEGRLSACARERIGPGRFMFKAAANPRGMQGYAAAR
ncbi:gamma-glutamyltransferase [Variovorax sp. RO1]|uniref:gamma-glutamyltransferase family protein n=1 Tax=Variovorax sp. RO1 TaxID=2066034 RepID=UPI000C718026|nr:gamma-glutamyltransferase family protein [Variovorax sp. RO1]PLC06454.1 gamma-glutamyltransferase [Variovorax sp. RO1]